MNISKLSKYFLCTLLTVTCFGQNIAFAKSNTLPTATEQVTEGENLPIDVEAKSAIVIDSATGQVIYEKNATEKLEVSSLNKLMSMLLFYEAIDSGQLSLDDKVTASDKACSKGGTQIFLSRNQEYTVDVLLKGVVITSANDACTALAEKLCGSESAFVTKMNEKAAALGLKNTKFTNCTGQKTTEAQYSTAEDMAVISKELVKHKTYFKYSSTYMDEITHPGDRKTQIINTNKLIRFYSGCDGLQTGSNGTENYCISMTAKKGQFRPIVVVLGAENATKRFNAAQELMDYTFANFSAVNIVKKDSVVKKSIAINGAISGAKIDALACADYALLLKKGEEKEIKKEVVLNDNLSAPIKKGDVIGQLIVKKGNEELNRIDIYASDDVMEAGIWSYMLKIITLFTY